MRPRLLDAFCGAGGASEGYVRAGFVVTGVDINPMPRYPYQFKQGDALEYLARYGHEYDVIHASPPCQFYSWATKKYGAHVNYPDLIPDVRRLLKASGKPYIIENVIGAPLEKPVMLRGDMFGLRVIRRRIFESNIPLRVPPKFKITGKVGFGESDYVSVAGHGGDGSGKYTNWCDAMDIHWMNKKELTESIPPDYTHWLGAQLMEHLGYPPRSYPQVRVEQLSYL